MLLGNADKGRVSLGVVDSSYNNGLAPGLGGSVGFNTDLKMFDNEKQTPSGGKLVTGKKSFSSRQKDFSEHTHSRSIGKNIPPSQTRSSGFFKQYYSIQSHTRLVSDSPLACLKGTENEYYLGELQWNWLNLHPNYNDLYKNRSYQSPSTQNIFSIILPFRYWQSASRRRDSMYPHV